MPLRHVAIFDANIPAGVAFIRSLGRARVPNTLFSNKQRPVGSFSRYAGKVLRCPSVGHTDVFADWLTSKMERGEIDLVAPTSDYVAYAVSEAHERLGISSLGQPSPAAVRDCLFKDWFAERMEDVGFPTPASAGPQSLPEALAAAETLGYPVAVKPRSHVAVGLARGSIAHSPDELERAFTEFALIGEHSSATRHNAHLRLPVLQQYLPLHETDVVSVAGCLGGDGEILAIGHCRKLRSWPPGLGTGTCFEALGEQPFTQRALDAVRKVLGAGLFELEVLVHRPTGDLWTIDLNPRAWGQVTLAMAHGQDMPTSWYEAVTGARLTGTVGHHRPPTYWLSGVDYYAGAVAAILAGPERTVRMRELAGTSAERRVGSVLDWRDPGPALVHSMSTLRHPARFVRRFLRYSAEDKGHAERSSTA